MKIPKLKNKAFEIDLAIYPFTIFVCFLDLTKLEELLRNYKFYKLTEEQIKGIIEPLKNISSGGRTLRLENGNVVIYIPSNLKYSQYMWNILTHEVFHATHLIMDSIGLNLTLESDEAFCYLNGYINEKIFEKI
jgi:hypothetical protein